ncbi:arginine--tRNA ligase [Candidatus Falkowbacteria bacterium]|jgi:arginyl-tRNA synthetase|nr:arginine--tRNA ligase [Candidatus Falkowbacteria bacterium]MBT7349022.1 arginine--tRNA ligase [Candidatus Falkowbacteria bacterium]MBT7500985.1 arginine--tRNA ligase [Candidatus Falkowbacteria bacterium]
MNKIKQQLADYLSKKLKIKVEPSQFTEPPNREMGDLALPCFDLAAQLKLDPQATCQEILKRAQADMLEIIEEVKAAGPYLNFVIKSAYLNKLVLESKFEPEKKVTEKVMIEYSQPNTHKEFHVGHSRNAILGAALVKIHRFLNKKPKNVIAANYIGDTGVHVAKVLWYITKFNSNIDIPKGVTNSEYLGQAYTEAVKKLEEDETLNQEVSDIHKELEAGDKDLVSLWRSTKEWSMIGFYDVYNLLNVEFDEWFWESEEEAVGKKIVQNILDEKTIPQIRKSDGAVIADLKEFKLEVLVLIKSDGNALYGAKDIPLGMKKFDKFKVKKSIYVVDNRQSLYIKQVFKLLDLLGYEDREKIHVAYDFVTLPDGAMASRKGNVVTFSKFYNEIWKKTIEETKERHDEWPRDRIEAVASKIALAAIKFFMLKYDNNSVIVFDVKKALAFEGDSGPYLLYTLARINSILRKTKLKGKVDYSLLTDKTEKALILHMSNFNEIVVKVAQDNVPMRLCTYLIDLTQLYNNFYHQCPVLKSEENLRLARLTLCSKVKFLLEKGLNLLNIDPVDEM